MRTLNNHFNIDFKAATERYNYPFSKITDSVDRAARKVKKKVVEAVEAIEETFEK